ncbi:hypothetical protein OUZ56_033058 [Daphnia magna]|uniref:Uncharacterized protein n=1 Tax=Daphnia magna TaxID=35525 RepID=A0ABR0BA53_9CRUS|nr:hypothetical protein OUZ56_033058 [Daphnia magna]
MKEKVKRDIWYNREMDYLLDLYIEDKNNHKYFAKFSDEMRRKYKLIEIRPLGVRLRDLVGHTSMAEPG